MNLILKLRWTLLAALLLTFVSGCAVTGKTRIVRHWHEEVGVKPYHSVLVVAMANDEKKRLVVERIIAETIAQRGVNAFASAQLVPHSGNETADEWRDKLLAAAHTVRAKSILVASLLKEDRPEEMKVGDVSTIPVPATAHYGTFGPYWTNQFQTVYEAGYLTSDATYYVETSLYDLYTLKPVWVVQSETVNPQYLEDGVSAYADIITRSLRDDGYLP